ncbi:hypothetical protein GCM10009087_22270 [Sphingomonas oligophenolica]
MDREEDEIAILAREKMIIGEGCGEAIDRNITEAEHDGRWSDMHKWHRVRLRVQRMRQQLDMTYALERSQNRREMVRAHRA